MKSIENKVEHDLLVDYDLTINGMIVGNVTVIQNGNLVLFGTITKDLIIESGKCIIYGTVNGDIHNKNGMLEIHGTVYGNLHEGKGLTKIDTNAVIKNKT